MALARELAPGMAEQRATVSEAMVAAEMRQLTMEFIHTVNTVPPTEPDSSAHRQTEIICYPHETELASSEVLPEGWEPRRVWEYASFDPYQELNPELTQATTDLIEGTMRVTAGLGNLREPALAYLDARRARGGRSATVVTRELAACDPVMGAWMNRLPAAECLRPVAHPWSDAGTVVHAGTVKTESGDDADLFQELTSSPALLALAGGSNDGRAVREREAWERLMISALVGSQQSQEDTLRITSLGTGTGEPVIDSGLAAMRDKHGRLEVHGVDVKADSLKVAEYLAERKKESVDPGRLEFTKHTANLLNEADLANVVRDTNAQVYEAIGFAEYVPSDYASDDAEQRMRATMERGGLLSAEAFYKTIYDNMPAGSILVTGNMRADSPQGRFVTEGLGWPLVLQRTTSEYLTILQRAGIPAEAVDLFVPGPGSAGVYNLVKITKL